MLNIFKRCFGIYYTEYQSFTKIKNIILMLSLFIILKITLNFIDILPRVRHQLSDEPSASEVSLPSVRLSGGQVEMEGV